MNTGNSVANGTPYPDELDRPVESDYDGEHDRREEE